MCRPGPSGSEQPSGPASIPHPLRHLGIYAYRVGFLKTYAGLAETPLEQREKLEQLRVLEHGYRIGVAVVADVGGLAGIDTPEQYAAFVRRMSSEAY